MKQLWPGTSFKQNHMATSAATQICPFNSWRFFFYLHLGVYFKWHCTFNLTLPNLTIHSSTPRSFDLDSHLLDYWGFFCAEKTMFSCMTKGAQYCKFHPSFQTIIWCAFIILFFTTRLSGCISAWSFSRVGYITVTIPHRMIVAIIVLWPLLKWLSSTKTVASFQRHRAGRLLIGWTSAAIRSLFQCPFLLIFSEMQ